MHQLTYEEMVLEDDPDIPALMAVYQTPDVARYLHISTNYFRYVTGAENVHFYKVYHSGRLIGSIHLEQQGPTLFLSILVFPAFQQMGFGTKMLSDIQHNVFSLDHQRIEVSIDEKNTASLQLFRKAGFVCTAKEDELLCFVYDRIA